MTRQGSILTFDEAKKAAVRSRPSVASSTSQSKRPTKRNSNSFRALNNRPTATASASKPTGNSRKRPAASQSGRIPKVSKFSEIRKNVAKNKAEKQFSRQFASDPSEASQSGPRAAVYKTEMGRQHKKSSKMQSGADTGITGFFSRFSFVGFDIRRSPKLIGTTMVVVCLALSCVFLYPTAQQFYTTQRDYDQVQAEYAALESRNNDIQAQVDLLSSEMGIEDRAREEFGWVKEGENAVTVHGLESDPQETTTYKKSIPAGSVEAPSSWYTSVLDAVFGVE